MNHKMDSVKKLKISKKKRKRAESVDDAKTKKKKSSKPAFSEINFKLSIKDDSYSSKAFEQFKEQAKLYPAESDYDIVLQYCKTSPECAEVFQLLESGKRKPTEASLIFDILELILIRTAEDLVQLQSVAQNITRRLLAAHMGLIYTSLGVTNKAAHIKSTLKLLTAMVMQGENAARNILTQFRLDHPCVKILLNRRDKKDPQDVRTCVIHFMLSFLIAGDNATVRQIVEHKDFLSAIFLAIEFDSVTTIQLVLSTLLDKVVENPALNKTCRVGVFGERSLTELGKLYQWKGPSNWHNKWKSKGKFSKKDENTEDPLLEVSVLDKSSVRDSVHQFLLQLTTSLVHGITFLDKSYGTSGKNQNHLITHLLTSLSAPHLDELQMELVVKTTAVCPDLLHWYLPSVRHAMEPRSSDSWVKCVTMVKKIYEAQPSILPVFTGRETFPPSKFVSIAMTQLVPPKDIWKTIMATLQREPGIRVEGLRLLLLILTRINANITHCLEKSDRGEGQLSEFLDLFRDSMKKILPDSNAWMGHWKNCVDEFHQRNSDKTTETADPSLSVSSIRVLLSVVCAYQRTIPSPMQSHALAYGTLLEGVQEVTSSQDEGGGDMWADMFQIMCESGERNIQWTKPTKTGKSFLYLLLETVTTVTGEELLKCQIVDWVVQMLQTTGLFPGLESELSVWLTQLRLVDTISTKAVLQFMEKAMFKLLRDPYTFTERVLESLSESLTYSPGGATSSTASVASTSDTLVDMILSLDEDITLDKGSATESMEVDTSTHLSFSPLIPVVLEELSCSESQSARVVPYVCRVIHSVLRMQTDPVALSLMINKYRKHLTGQTLLTRLAYFLPDVQISPSSPVKKKRKSDKSVDVTDRTPGDVLEEIFEKSHVETSEELQQQYSEELVSLLDQVPVSGFEPISKQCIQYLCWGERHQVPTQLYEETLVCIVCRLCSPTDSNNATTTTATTYKSLQYIVTEILSHAALRRMIDKLTSMATTCDTVKLSPRKKQRAKSSSEFKPWEISVVAFLRRLFDEIPEEFLDGLKKIVKTCTKELDGMLDNLTAESLSKNTLLMGLVSCFWPYTKDVHMVKITEAVVSDIVSKNHEEKELTLLCKLLARLDMMKMELSGQKLDKRTVKDLAELAVSSDRTDSLCQSVLRMFTQFPPYCDCIYSDVFNNAIETGLFGMNISGRDFEKEKIKSILSKVVKTVQRQHGVLDLVKIWMTHSCRGDEMFETWVKRMESGLRVKSLNLCPVAELYLRKTREPDVKVMSILLSQQIKYLESSLLTPVEGETHYSSDVAEEREGALDAVLLHAQTDSLQSLRDKLQSAVNKGQVTHVSQIHCYRKLTDFVLTQTPEVDKYSVLLEVLSGLRDGFCEKLSKKESDQDGVYAAYMESMNAWLEQIVSAGSQDSLKAEILGRDIKKMRAFVRLGLKHCFGGKFFRVLTRVLEVVIGVKKCEDTSKNPEVVATERRSKSSSRRANGNEEQECESSRISKIESESDEEMESESESNEEVENESESSGIENLLSESDEDAEIEDAEEDDVESETSGMESESEEGDSDDTSDASGSSGMGDSEMSANEESAEGIETTVPPLSPEYLTLVQEVYSMLLSHSAFLKTMLSEGEEDENKDSLLDLLLCLVHSSNSVCDSQHLAVWFGAYGASLTLTDQKLLHLIELYEGQGCEVTRYRPYLHGSKAIEHYSVMQNMGPSLSKEVKMEQVLECLDPARLWKSVLNMLLTRQPSSLCTPVSIDSLHSVANGYDPCFLLPSFCHLLAPENVVNCHAFVEHHCLSYTIAALSCHSNSLRAVAYNVLSRFYQQLQLSRLQEKQQLLLCLDCVRNSLEQPNTKLACIITVFLAKAVVILLNPDHAMYSLINSFLLLKPSLDILNVPEFYKLFNSSSLEYKTERGWVVGLLQEGLRETSDYRIFEKRFTFKLLLTFYDSALSDQYMKRQILQILTRACAIKTVAFDLTKNHGLLSWLAALMQNCDAECLQSVMVTLHTLWFAMLDKRDSTSTHRRNPVLPINFINEVIALLATSLPTIRCFGSKETFSHFVEVLESSVKHRNTAHQYNRTHNVAYSESGDVTLCAGHVMCLLSHWCQLNCPQETSLCSTVKDACISLFMPNRSLHPQAADNNDFHVLPERHLAIMMESSSNKECLQRLISLVQRVQLSPEMKEKLKDASFINGLIVLLHTSLQLVVSVRWECHILHDYFEWVRNFVNENQGLRLELTERKPLSVCVHELVRLLCHRVKQEHARNGCTVRLEEYKSFTELLREKIVIAD